MAVPPIQYRATDYPPKYRPVGYWRHARRQVEAADGEAVPRTRRRLWVFLAVLAATLVLHAGIAAAYLGADSGTTSAKSSQPASKTAAKCDAKGQPDPAADPQPTPSADTPVSGPGDQQGSGTSDPSAAGGGSTRGAL
jgi:hypothetical protein